MFHDINYNHKGYCVILVLKMIRESWPVDVIVGVAGSEIKHLGMYCYRKIACG